MTRSTATLALALATFLLFPPRSKAQVESGAQSPGPYALQALDDFVASHRSRFGWPGVAVAVAAGDSVLFARGYGGETVAGLPITDGTPFYIGSVSKTMTALAVARLSTRGEIDLDEPVEAYLPDFTLRPPFEPRSISVRHLLHHRSGLAQWDGHDLIAQKEGRFDHMRQEVACVQRLAAEVGEPLVAQLRIMLLHGAYSARCWRSPARARA